MSGRVLRRVALLGLMALAAASCRNEVTIIPPEGAGPEAAPQEGGSGLPDYPGVVYPYENDPDYPEMRSDLEAAYSLATNYWSTTLPQVWGIQYTPPSQFLSYERDGEIVCGGVALPASNAFFCYPPENLVAVDFGLFLSAFKGAGGDIFTYFTVFHEVGHSIQWQIGEQSSTEATIGQELQADCLAGAAMRDLTEQGLIIEEPGDADELVATLFTLKDRITTDYFDPGAHGNSAQRIESYQYGQRTDPAACVAAYPADVAVPAP